MHGHSSCSPLSKVLHIIRKCQGLREGMFRQCWGWHYKNLMHSLAQYLQQYGTDGGRGIDNIIHRTTSTVCVYSGSSPTSGGWVQAWTTCTRIMFHNAPCLYEFSSEANSKRMQYIIEHYASALLRARLMALFQYNIICWCIVGSSWVEPWGISSRLFGHLMPETLPRPPRRGRELSTHQRCAHQSGDQVKNHSQTIFSATIS